MQELIRSVIYFTRGKRVFYSWLFIRIIWLFYKVFLHCQWNKIMNVDLWKCKHIFAYIMLSPKSKHPTLLTQSGTSWNPWPNKCHCNVWYLSRRGDRQWQDVSRDCLNHGFSWCTRGDTCFLSDIWSIYCTAVICRSLYPHGLCIFNILSAQAIMSYRDYQSYHTLPVQPPKNYTRPIKTLGSLEFARQLSIRIRRLRNAWTNKAGKMMLISCLLEQQYTTILKLFQGTINPLTSRPGCMPGSRYTGVRVLFFVIWSWNC